MIKWILISIIALLIIILAVIFAFKGRKKKKIDYKTFFIMGIIFIGFGIAIQNYGSGRFRVYFPIVWCFE